MLVLGANLGVRADSASPQPAVLQQASTHSQRALASATLAVARAGDRLVAVGERGVILLSDDSGKNWRQAAVPVSVSITALQFIDDKTGWAVGHLGVVLRSRDGGETWTKQFDGTQAASLALEGARKFAKTDAAPEQIQSAMDAAELLVEDGPDKPFLALHFNNERTGFIVGAYNLIFRTDDGGDSWQPLLTQVENPDALHLYGITAVGDALIIAGEQGTLLRSTDGGQHFAALSSPYDGSFFGVTTTAKGAVLAYGMRGNTFRSEDSGETWEQVDTGVEAGLSAATLLADGSVLLSVQSGELLVSRDDGQSFTEMPIAQRLPLAGIAQAPDQSIIVASLGGVQRVNP